MSQISDLDSRAQSYEERIDGIVSTNTKLHEALRSQELGSGSRDDFNNSLMPPCNIKRP
jgi:hypothetical protein